MVHRNIFLSNPPNQSVSALCYSVAMRTQQKMADYGVGFRIQTHSPLILPYSNLVGLHWSGLIMGI